MCSRKVDPGECDMTSLKISTLFGILICIFIPYLHCGNVNDSHLKVPFNKHYARFQELSITDITPKGWLRRYLEVQKDGLMGHIDNVGYPFNTCGWAGTAEKVERDPEDWWPYEQTGYWIDGLTRTAFLLDDSVLVARAMTYIDHVLDNPDTNGYLGPREIKSRWPHVVFFRALMAYYSATKDPRVPDAMVNHYLNEDPSTAVGRDYLNIENACWLYGLTGDKRVRDYAVKLFDQQNAIENPNIYYNDWPLDVLLSDQIPTMHGVSFTEYLKIPAVMYSVTGNKTYLKASRNGFGKVDQHHMLIDGIPSSCEYMAGKESRTGHETCVVTDYTWSAGYMLMATGEAEWADKIEKGVFNAGLGSLKKDFKAHQYFACPNQVVACTRSSTNPHGGTQVQFRPNFWPPCCTGNIHRFVPNYITRMFLSDGKDGVFAALYGPAECEFLAADNVPVKIIEQTDYPFSDKIEFIFQTKNDVEFSFYVRVPHWCENAAMEINGEKFGKTMHAGSVVEVRRTFQDNDQIVLTLPMKLRTSHWVHGAGEGMIQKVNNKLADIDPLVDGVGIEYGPLVFSLKIDEKWQVERSINRDIPDSLDLWNFSSLDYPDDFPAWIVTPQSDWNYALALDENDLASCIEITRKPMTDEPWRPDNAPLRLHVPARKIKDWKLIEYFNHRKGLFTPALADPRNADPSVVETVTLIPYGATHLRMTIFPNWKPTIKGINSVNPFYGEHEVTLEATAPDAKIYYTLDGSEPSRSSKLYTDPVKISKDCTMNAFAILKDGQETRVRTGKFVKQKLQPDVDVSGLKSGLSFRYFNKIVDVDSFPLSGQAEMQGVVTNFRTPDHISILENTCIEFSGYINVPQDGIYSFYPISANGSRLIVQDQTVVTIPPSYPNDHVITEQHGYIALQKGMHPIRLIYNRVGSKWWRLFGDEPSLLFMKGPGMEKCKIDDSMLFTKSSR